jgi:large subunit ribosomal protein L35
MPKMKTHRGAAKRFKLTGSGKIMRSKAYQNHRKRKSDKALRLLGTMFPVAPSDKRRIRRALGV